MKSGNFKLKNIAIGVNALDKCPDTPLNEINNVNSDGCSPSQLNN